MIVRVAGASRYPVAPDLDDWFTAKVDLDEMLHLRSAADHRRTSV
jgi:hypothetical protein